jgi:hypothetical protein
VEDRDDGVETVAKCRAGHLFTTIWTQGASYRSSGRRVVRLRYCPVGRHLTLVAPMQADELTAEQRKAATRYHDARIHCGAR